MIDLFFYFLSLIGNKCLPLRMKFWSLVLIFSSPEGFFCLTEVSSCYMVSFRCLVAPVHRLPRDPPEVIRTGRISCAAWPFPHRHCFAPPVWGSPLYAIHPTCWPSSALRPRSVPSSASFDRFLLFTSSFFHTTYQWPRA